MMLDYENSGINGANINTLFNGVASNPVGNPIAFDFLVNRWSDIEKSLGTNYFVNFFRYLCNRLNTQQELDQVGSKHSIINHPVVQTCTFKKLYFMHQFSVVETSQ